MTLTASVTDRAYLTYLRRLLVQRFSTSELRTLCFDLGVDAESVADGPSKPDLARGLVDHLEQRHRIAELVAYIRQVRDDIQLEAVPPASSVPSPGSVSLSGTASPAPLAVSREPALAWSFDLPGQPMAAPVVIGRVCLIASQESGRHAQGGIVRALDLITGEVRWEHRFRDAVVGGLARSSETQALVSLPSWHVPGESALIAIDVTGQIAWRTEFEVQQVSAPTACWGMAAVTGNGHEIILLDLETGKELVAVSLPVDVALAAPGCDAETVYVPCRAPTLLAVDRSGELRWRFDVEGVLSGVQLNQTPLVTPDLVVAALSSGAVLALSREQGRLVWETQVGPRGKRLTPPVSDGRRVFVGARDGVYALDLADGTLQWVFRTGAYVTSRPALADEVLCIAGDDRHLYGLDPRSGERLWQHTLAQEVKTPPLLVPGDESGPYAIVVDCCGGVSALTYPVSASAHETAGRWSRAARAWEAGGDLWHAAEAWVRHAESLAAQPDTADAQAQAWVTAARLFAAVGARNKAAHAREQYARILALPVIGVEVRHGGLVLEAWSQLRLIVRNRGYGLARNLVIRIAGEQVAWQDAPDGVVETPPLAALSTGQSHEQTLDMRPLAYGESVPLRLQIAYLDQNGEPHRREETLHVPVAKEAAGRAPGAFLILQDAGLMPSLGMDLATSEATLDLEIRIGRGSRAYTVELTLNGGQVFAGGTMPLSVVDWVPGGDVAADGRALFDVLLRDGAVRKGWHVARGQAEMRGALRRVRLRIDEDAAELHRLPWELLHDEDVMIAACETTPFSRYLPVEKPWGRPVSERPLRVLGVIPNPLDLAARYDVAPIDVEMEKYMLASAFAEIDPRRIRLAFLKPPVTLDRLSRAMLEGGYHWLHFVGHGRHNARQERVDLLMEDDRGTTRAIADHLFCRMLAHRGVQPQLVFLSACQSALGPDSRILEGLAPRLVQIGVPAVVAMRDRVPMRVAQRFTRVFYESLTGHGTVDRAMNHARDALLSAEVPNVASPVLYLRLPSGRLWDTVTP